MKSIVSILVIIAVLIALDGYIIKPVWGAEADTDEIVFSLNVKDKPRSAVLRTIYEQIGFNFLVSEGAKNVPITISLSKVPLLEGLNQLIKSAGIGNHAVVWKSDKNISIIIINGSSIASNARERPYLGGSLQVAADQPRLTESEKDTIAKPSPPEIFSRHGTQGKNQQAIVSVQPREIYDMRYHTR